ncbi:MAG: HpcH/HpaI aldolase/citrate lyase family protein [Acidimicrobiales bacterium]
MSSRSHLYVPGDQADKLGRALDRGADALIVDLEDSVAPDAKPSARRLVAGWLARAGDHAEGRAPVEIWVRVNAVGSARPQDIGDDVAAVVGPALAGICLAKTQSAEDVELLGELLTGAEIGAGMEPGTLHVSALIESARGLLAAPAIATAARLGRLQVGEADLAAELRVAAGPDEGELAALRLQVVVASAAAGIAAPIGPVSTNFEDLGAFRAGTERLKRLGFGGRAVIHPAQIPVVHEVFTPSPDEVRQARELVDRFDAAVASGSGVIVDEGGRMVDEAVVRVARNLLARAGADPGER